MDDDNADSNSLLASQAKIHSTTATLRSSDATPALTIRTAGGRGYDDDGNGNGNNNDNGNGNSGSNADIETGDVVAENADHALVETPLPRGPMAAVVALQLAEAWNNVMLFPFVVFMVQDELGVADEQLVGVYAGLIGCVWSLGQFVSATGWGYASDAFGRRPVLLVGSLGASCAALFFGTSKSVLQAALSRFVGGMLNGNIAVLKSVIGDTTDASNQARGFSLMSLMWGFGSVLAPAVGGLLARPADNAALAKALPKALVERPRGLFVRYPYLLPCAVQFVVGMIACAVCALFLPETRWGFRTSSLRSKTQKPPRLRGRDDDRVVNADVPMDDLEAVPLDDGGASSASEADDTLREGAETDAAEESSVWANKQAMLSTVLYGVVAFTWTINDEVFPLFCASAARHGGMAFSSSQIGLALGWCGAILIVYQLAAFPALVARCGLLPLFRSSALSAGLVFMILPISGLAAQRDARLGWAILLLALLMYTVSGCGCFTCVMVLVNNSASTAAQRGKVNGMGQTFASLARAIGPALAGALWSVSVRFSTVPGHQWLPFVLASSGALFAWTMSFKLSSALAMAQS
mmetsp:Transcript_5488/g.14737  ORF Transcript_5488/g.14737 Transcript_5488/m.14737 type:complete len:581 (-) Transcript_5488:269-2011(-)